MSEVSSAGSSDPDMELVLRCYETFARGDIEAAVAPLHPDVEWIEPDEFPTAGDTTGRPVRAVAGCRGAFSC